MEREAHCTLSLHILACRVCDTVIERREMLAARREEGEVRCALLLHILTCRVCDTVMERRERLTAHCRSIHSRVLHVTEMYDSRECAATMCSEPLPPL